MNAVMIATNGIFKIQYPSEVVTLRLFEAPELQLSDLAVFQVVVTYVNSDGVARQELDTLSREQIEYCREAALELEGGAGLKPFSNMFKAYMAQAYWDLIK